MENASNALLMAAGILVGILIISIGVTLFISFSELGKTSVEQMEANKIAEWNQNYLKYYGSNTVIKDGKEINTPILVTAHDIVSVANHANQNNINYELQNQIKYEENSYYVQVQVGNDANFEKKTEQEKNEFLQNNSIINESETKYYICTDVEISTVTKRVMYICFKEYK